MSLTMHIVCMGNVKLHTVLVRKHKSKRWLGRPTHRFEDNIKLNLKQGWIIWTDTSVSYVHFVLGSDTILFGTHLQDHMASYSRRHPKCSLPWKPYIWCNSSSSGKDPVVGSCEHCNNLQVPWKVEIFQVAQELAS